LHPLAGIGQLARALATIDEALTRSPRDEERWCATLEQYKAGFHVVAQNYTARRRSITSRPHNGESGAEHRTEKEERR